MARALDKVQKKITKKRGSKPTALHENSRDARRLRAASMREDKLHKLMSAAQRQQQVYIDRISYFQSLLPESNEEPVQFDETALEVAVQGYIDRRQEELDTQVSERRKGRPMSKAEEEIRRERDVETREFESGFWCADLRDAECCKKLARWGGSWGGLNTLKFVRVTKGQGVKDSSFPPKGLS